MTFVFVKFGIAARKACCLPLKGGVDVNGEAEQDN